jgi:hypothetical protein
MNIPNPEEVNSRFFDDIYKPYVEKCKSIQNIQSVLSVLDNGAAVLDDNTKCDQYIAFYGGHHFHKLYAAFASTNFQHINGKNLEIVDWGCGQALATCVLIDYFIENSFKPNIVSITLLEPSSIALERGYNLACQMLQHKPYTSSAIRMVNKYIDDLESGDFISGAESIKVHLFSNIIDIEAFSLEKLHALILSSFQGINRFICTSPDKHGSHRLNNFAGLFLPSCSDRTSVSSEKPICKEIFYFKTGRFESREISRYERQFTAKLV